MNSICMFEHALELNFKDIIPFPSPAGAAEIT
jgi:hypothetical protein